MDEWSDNVRTMFRDETWTLHSFYPSKTDKNTSTCKRHLDVNETSFLWHLKEHHNCDVCSFLLLCIFAILCLLDFDQLQSLIRAVSEFRLSYRSRVRQGSVVHFLSWNREITSHSTGQDWMEEYDRWGYPEENCFEHDVEQNELDLIINHDKHLLRSHLTYLEKKTNSPKSGPSATFFDVSDI